MAESKKRPLTAKQEVIHNMRRPVADGGGGKTRQEIATALGISVNVVSKTITVINKKLGIKGDGAAHSRSEDLNPEMVAPVLDAMTDPYAKLKDVMEAAGLPKSTVQGLIMRLRVKYHRVVTEARDLQRRELSELLGKKIHLALQYMDDKVLSEASFRDLSMGASQMIEKQQLLLGQPTQIISDHERAKLHELAGPLMAEIKRRGITVEGTATRVENPELPAP